ncbi:hypothetical protein J6590_013974 [Homalodisca vitripennis]|nr:hypothetical protein J6590_013974 [Homalodisca vitripennis]
MIFSPLSHTALQRRSTRTNPETSPAVSELTPLACEGKGQVMYLARASHPARGVTLRKRSIVVARCRTFYRISANNGSRCTSGHTMDRLTRKPFCYVIVTTFFSGKRANTMKLVHLFSLTWSVLVTYRPPESLEKSLGLNNNNTTGYNDPTTTDATLFNHCALCKGESGEITLHVDREQACGAGVKPEKRPPDVYTTGDLGPASGGSCPGSWVAR